MRRREKLTTLRHQMVRDQIVARGIRDPLIVRAMEIIPRHQFVPYTKPPDAYVDGPLPIGQGQTISQPYITAYMTELLHLRRTDRVLEVGTGSGYQAALLSCLCAEVYSIEIIAAHSTRTRKVLEELRYTNIHLRLGDGREGWKEAAPFDRIVVTAAARNEVPAALLHHLAENGRLVIPIGKTVYSQRLLAFTRRGERFVEEEDLPVRFVPLVESGNGRLRKKAGFF